MRLGTSAALHADINPNERQLIMRHTTLAAIAIALAPMACMQQQEDPEVNEESVASTTQAVTEGASTIVALSAPLQTADTPMQATPDAPLVEGEVKVMVETSVQDMGIVTDPSCISYNWSGLTATATFTNCQLVVTGAVLNGTVALTVVTQPLGVEFGFQNLTVDGRSVDGTIDLYLTGQLGALQAHLDANLALSNGVQTVSFEEFGIVADQSGITADGLASGEVHDVDIEALHWNYGVCLPVSGSLQFEEANVPITVTFLATTPSTGSVMVQIGTLPPNSTQIFQPCP
jgi:hypothetical protein